MIIEPTCYTTVVGMIHAMKAARRVEHISRQEVLNPTPGQYRNRRILFDDPIEQVFSIYSWRDDKTGRRTAIKLGEQKRAFREHPAIGLIIIHANNIMLLRRRLLEIHFEDEVTRRQTEERLVREYNLLFETALYAKVGYSD